jgi:hypothetical protein
MNPLLLLAQTDVQFTYEQPSAGGAIGGIIGLLLYLAVIAFLIAANWKIFTKAGKPGWASLIPIYNIIVFLEIVGRPAWWVVLLFIPFVNFVVGVMVSIDLAKSFGKGTGFAVGLILLAPVFLLMLAFGSARYQGPAVQA